VQVYVSRVRRALDDDELLVTSRAGYRLRVRPGELDLERFERLAEDGRRAFADGRSELAVEHLRDALALWRGPPLADLAFEPFAQAEIARLDEQRLVEPSGSLSAYVKEAGRARRSDRRVPD